MALFKKPKRNRLVAGLRVVALQDFTFMVDCTPEIVLNAIDFHKDLIQVPLSLSVLAHLGGAFRSNLSSEDRAEPIDPEPHAFMADIDASLVEQIFNIAK